MKAMEMNRKECLQMIAILSVMALFIINGALTQDKIIYSPYSDVIFQHYFDQHVAWFEPIEKYGWINLLLYDSGFQFRVGFDIAMLAIMVIGFYSLILQMRWDDFMQSVAMELKKQ